jgi:hypothetical protein
MENTKSVARLVPDVKRAFRRFVALVLLVVMLLGAGMGVLILILT